MESRSAVKDLKQEIPGEVNEKGVYEFPKLYKKTSRGNVGEWQMFIRMSNGVNPTQYYDEPVPKGVRAYYWTVAQEKTASGDGKPRVSEETAIETGKNLGKANETNVFTQALLESYSIYRTKLRQKYNVRLGETDEYPWRKPPMRFNLVKDHLKKLVFPAYLLTKYDGIFAEAVYNPMEKKVEIVSRQLVPFINVGLHEKELAPVFKKYPNIMLFGEFYKHGLPLQQISGMTRDTSSTNKLNLFLFDAIMRDEGENMVYRDRRALLDKVFEEFGDGFKYVKKMPVYEVGGLKELYDRYEEFVKAGYEGGVYYNPDGKYKFFYTTSRSTDVLKMKPRRSAEFKVVGFKEGRGKNKGLVTFVLETEKGDQFSAEPNLDDDVRKKLFKEFDGGNFHYKDKMATVTYSELSEKGIPMQPKFIAIRAPEDF